MVERLAGRKQISSENLSFGLSTDDTNSLEAPRPDFKLQMEGRPQRHNQVHFERALARKKIKISHCFKKFTDHVNPFPRGVSSVVRCTYPEPKFA